VSFSRPTLSSSPWRRCFAGTLTLGGADQPVAVGFPAGQAPAVSPPPAWGSGAPLGGQGPSGWRPGGSGWQTWPRPAARVPRVTHRAPPVWPSRRGLPRPPLARLHPGLEHTGGRFRECRRVRSRAPTRRGRAGRLAHGAGRTAASPQEKFGGEQAATTANGAHDQRSVRIARRRLGFVSREHRARVAGCAHWQAQADPRLGVAGMARPNRGEDAVTDLASMTRLLGAVLAREAGKGGGA
jgi:hypothetical protein